MTERLNNLLRSAIAAAAAKLLQSCPTLCDSIDGSPPGSPVPGILQARVLEWVAISSSNAWKWKVKVKSLSRVRLLATPWTAAHQAPPSVGFSRQEYWSGVPLTFKLFSHMSDYCHFFVNLYTRATSYVGRNFEAIYILITYSLFFNLCFFDLASTQNFWHVSLAV